jgi:dTDP-6-deoxy-L-talose 4-dehydrogenase (NAD+)
VRIAVSGATGFIGRHVVVELERRSLSPVLICRPDSVVTEAPGAGAALSRHTIVRLDISAPPANAFDAIGRPDALIHLAWSGLPNYRSLHHVETELPIQYAFLENAIASGLRNCVVTGTCLEYGNQTGQLDETLETLPNNSYALAKDTLRRQLEHLQRTTPFNLTWARLFYTYGDGQSPTSLWPQLQRAVLAGEPQFSMSGGEQLRDYLPVNQVADRLVSLALTARNNGIVNVCSGAPISVRELVERWIAQNGWSIGLDLGRYPYPDYEPMAFWGNARKLHELTSPISSPHA